MVCNRSSLYEGWVVIEIVLQRCAITLEDVVCSAVLHHADRSLYWSVHPIRISEGQLSD